MSKNVESKTKRVVAVVSKTKKHHHEIATAISQKWGTQVFVVVFTAMAIAELVRFLRCKDAVVLYDSPDIIACTGELLDEIGNGLDLSRVYSWHKPKIAKYFSLSTQLMDPCTAKRRRESKTPQRKNKRKREQGECVTTGTDVNPAHKTHTSTSDPGTGGKQTSEPKAARTNPNPNPKQKQKQKQKSKSKVTRTKPKPRAPETPKQKSEKRRRDSTNDAASLRQEDGGIPMRDTTLGISIPKEASTCTTDAPPPKIGGMPMPDTSQGPNIRDKHLDTDSVSHTPVCTNQGQEQPSDDYPLGSLDCMNSQSF